MTTTEIYTHVSLEDVQKAYHKAHPRAKEVRSSKFEVRREEEDIQKKIEEKEVRSAKFEVRSEEEDNSTKREEKEDET
jgi:hypothetical protein